MALTKLQFRELLRKDKPLLLDGAVGSTLLEIAGAPDPVLWTSHLNFTSPALVRRMHEAYAAAGADSITTNTFRTNYLAWKSSGSDIEYSAFVSAGVRPALEVKKLYPNLLIAGSNAPAEDCYQAQRTVSTEDLLKNHEMHCAALLDAGVDFLLHETQSHLDEIELLCRLSDGLDAAYALSLYVTDALCLLSGEPLAVAMERLEAYAVDLLCFNCLSPETFARLCRSVPMPERWGFYLNCGTGNFETGQISGCLSPDAYEKVAAKGLLYKPSLIGGCCGTTAQHITKLRSLLDA
jgi:homocysteine S-methyltransferase